MRMQGPLKGRVSPSVGFSDHVTCTGFIHSSTVLQVKHALCHLPNHKYVENRPDKHEEESTFALTN